MDDLTDDTSGAAFDADAGDINGPDIDRTSVIGDRLRAGDYRAAERLALSVEGEWQHAESLTQVARALVAAGRIDEARTVWEKAVAIAVAGEDSRSPQDSLDSSSVLHEVAEVMAEAGEIECARQVADRIKNGYKRQRALHFVGVIAAGGEGAFYYLHDTPSPCTEP